jgi:cell wall-associated NlpC family hydrolase
MAALQACKRQLGAVQAVSESMAAGNVMSRVCFAAVIVVVWARAEPVHAEERASAGRGSFGVPLQPFSLRGTDDESPRAESIRVAYYTPRSQPAVVPRAEAVEEDNDDTEVANDVPIIRSNQPVVEGTRAVLRNGVAYAPSEAPDNIKNAIWAVNTLRHKPYVWGGGHGSFNDYGYDCSGAVSFALYYAGLLDSPLPSNDLCHYGRRGRGRWITIYSRNGHTFAIIAGLRLDTTDMRDGEAVGPRWYVDGRNIRGFEARHPAGW